MSDPESSCFFPDGVTNGAANGASFVPCNPSAGHSACCSSGETCVGNNLCLSINGLIYRGGCTDKTFGDPSCPSLCTSTTGRNAGPQNSYIFMKPCDASNGQLQWVCNLNGNCTDSSMRFNLHVGGPQEVNITGKAVTSATSSSLPTTTAATSTSSLPTVTSTNECSTTKGTSATAVGAGVGIPLGVLLLLALAWGFWERRRRNRMIPAPMQQYNTVPMTNHKPPPVTSHEAPNNVPRSELPPGYLPNELA